MTKTIEFKKERVFCNLCLREMTHWVLSSVRRSGYHEISQDFGIYWENTYDVFECQECHNATFRIRHWNDEAQWSHDKKDYHDSYYPPLVSRPKPLWFDKLDVKFKKVLDEVYIAFDANIRFLAAFGARTALDLLIVDQIGDVGTFNDKLNKLESNGDINSAEKELLNAVIESGHAAAHRGFAPDQKLLNSVIDILESLFDKFYIKPDRDKELLTKARDLIEKTPKRTSKQKIAIKIGKGDESMNKGIIIVALSLLITFIASTSDAASFLGFKERKYYKTCKEEISTQLKAPSTAKFPSYSKDMITEVTDSIKFHFFVDSQNTYGAMIRTDCECIVWKSGPRAGELSAHIPEQK